VAFKRGGALCNVRRRTGNWANYLPGGSVIMSKQGEFLVFCIEMYKSAKNITGKQAINLFKQYGVVDYIMSCYEALHTTGTNYIIEDIDLFIEARQQL
jgi:hypothetical protein